MPLGHNPSTRHMPLGHKVNIYGIFQGTITLNLAFSFETFSNKISKTERFSIEQQINLEPLR